MIFLLLLFVPFTTATMKETFKMVEGELALTRDFCLDENSLKIDDLLEERIDKLLCFYKCIMEQLGILDENGGLDVEALINIPRFDKEKFPQVAKCFRKIGRIGSCEDMKKAMECLAMAIKS